MQQVVESLIVQGIYFQVYGFFFMNHCQRVAEDVFQPVFGTFFLEIECGGHCITVTNADRRMS